MIPAFALRRLSLIAQLLLLAALFLPTSLRAQPATPFSFIAIGDGGEPGPSLENNARSMKRLVDSVSRAGNPVSLLLFLGDNFYPNGLNHPGPIQAKLVNEVLGPLRPVMEQIGRDSVQAIAGNHDYYCRTINGIPFNTCNQGNEQEESIGLWNYHFYQPASIRRAIVEGGKDSVELILFDSAYLIAHKEEYWKPILDSLERLLVRSAASPGITWRLFLAHHSPYTVGDHGGWRRWIPSEHRVGYIGNCIGERMDPFRYAQEFFSQQDNCTPRYQHYIDSLMGIINRTGARIQAMLAGHDHSLQLLYYPDRNCANCPKVFVISGAGSKQQRVKSPTPPHEYTHPLNNDIDKGASVGGFIHCIFLDDNLMVTFIDGKTGEALDMGGGEKRFAIDRSGVLLNAVKEPQR